MARSVEIASWVPYCGAAPLPEELLARWNLDPVLLAVLGGLALLLTMFWHRIDRSARRRLPAAWLLAVVLFVSPLCAATSALFWVRSVHHLVLIAALAPLLARGLPRDRAAPGSLGLWTALHALVVWAWHVPGLYAAALSSDALYWAMQASLLGSAMLFWSAVRRAEPLAAAAALLATMVQMGLLGALLTFASAPLYAPHLASTILWGLGPLEDQQLAGLIMWAPGAGVYLAAAAVLFSRWLARTGHPEAA